MDDQITQISAVVAQFGLPLLGKLLGALVLWIAGTWLIRLIERLVAHAMATRQMDVTLAGYLKTSLGMFLKLLLVIGILGVLGVETTSFAAVLAAAGVAIGMAWSGLLANFAAGVFLVLLRPFKRGDMITAGGVTGGVVEIGLFATTIHTADNLVVVVGNNKLFGDNIVNYSQNPYRAVDLRAQIGHGVDPQSALEALRPRIAAIKNVLADPAPVLEILELTIAGTTLVVRPFCSNSHYWQVTFDANRVISEVFSQGGFPLPERRRGAWQGPAARPAGAS